MTPVGVGILGAGTIARLGVGPAIAAAPGLEVVAVGSRSIERARRLAADIGGTAHPGYREVVEHPGVELVYVALPNDAHLPWALEAIGAGRHVLVEKPLGLTAVEVATAFDAAEAAGLVLVEASWYRWHPRTRAAEELVAGGALGEVRSVDAGFTFGGVPDGDYRLDPARGGGALYDVGCYAVSGAVWSAGAPLAVESVRVRRHPGGVDLATDAALVGPSGAEVRISAAIDRPERQWLHVTGTEGHLELATPAWTAWHPDPADLVTPTGVRRFEAVDPYRCMVTAVAGRIRGGGDWVVPRSDSEAVAATIDAVSATEQG